MTAGMEEKTLEELMQTVDANHGDCKLFIHCVTPEHQEVIIEASPFKGLKPGTRSKERVESLIGPGAIWFSARSNANSS
jgi:hypothetical protein